MLRPVLFLVHVNDLCRHILTGSVVCIADDTNVVVRARTTEELEAAIGGVKQ